MANDQLLFLALLYFLFLALVYKTDASSIMGWAWGCTVECYRRCSTEVTEPSVIVCLEDRGSWSVPDNNYDDDIVHGWL